MAEYTLAAVCDAIETTIATAVGMNNSESYDELSEAHAADDLPLVMVYPESSPGDPLSWGDRTTFRQGVVVTEFEVRADVYCAVRSSELGENMKVVTNMIDTMINVLQAAGRNAPPFFGAGSEAIKSFKWSFKRATFRYSPNLFAGVRFTFTIRVF